MSTEKKAPKEDNELSYYKHALDQSSIVAITNQKGIITHVNENFCKISKYSQEELLGQDHRIINSGHHSKDFIREIWTTIANGRIWKGELKNKAKDGSYYWVDTTIIPFLDQTGKPYQYVAIRSDITDKKKGEEEIKKMLIKAEYHNKQLIDFCNIISHNLRAPLVNISMLLDFIEETDKEEDKEEAFQRIRPVVNHINEIFNKLVESLQVKQDLEIQSKKLDFRKCIKKSLIDFQTQIKEYNITVEIDCNEAPTVYYPEKYLDSIFSNLISNAIKYRSPDRNLVIKINTKLINNHILLTIKDNGLGINLKRHKEAIFKIRRTFHKHPDAKGLGLFMTKTQIDAMNGEIWVESQEHTGSTFFIKINNQKR
ncbi:PAS domain S-box protein [Flavobacterium sufflavum]|uniref:histidine kinase n=1 Tax=Flavobacterium sufflavum TaxID=1921138 RepID=A0A3S2XM20_9FLAO|nr:PAS domain-containing sensor histidine kinase [Flavobacterium sufflavum]RVT79769.1 PAS domain S-box protein [Flavobacterium sufflavum]